MSSILLGRRQCAVLAAAAAAAFSGASALAAPYASGVSVSGTTVNFVLNESADALQVSINGGAPIALDGSTIGAKSFTLGSPTDKFSITASKNAAAGYLTPTGAQIAGTNEVTKLQISSDTNVNNRFSASRGVAVNLNPSAGAAFGRTYVTNGTATAAPADAALGLPGRSMGRGVYALTAAGADALGQGNTPLTGGISFSTSGTAAPWRLAIGSDNSLFISDWSDGSGNLYMTNANVQSGQALLNGGPLGTNGTPSGTQNHGSITGVAVTGSLAAGNLTAYVIDEDMQLPGDSAATKLNALWRHDIGGSAPSTAAPTRLNQVGINFVSNTFDLARNNRDGKLFIANDRSTGNDPGLFVLSADGSTVLFDSLAATKAAGLDNDTTLAGVQDILADSYGLDISPDGSLLAISRGNGDTFLLPIGADGLPDISKRVVLDSFAAGFARDVAFDAAGNLYVTSFTGTNGSLLRVFSPGGATSYTTAFDGSNFTFGATAVPEPTTLSLLGLGAAGLVARRRRTAR